MYTKKDLVDLFTAKLCTRLSLKNPDDYKIVIFGDAYGDFAPRTVADLRKENIRDVLDWLSMRFFEYFDGKTLNKSEFDKWHKDTCEEFIKQFNIKSKTEPIKYGKAQKIVNMTFKYLYCFRDSNDYIDKFEHCHMPIDSIIIDWFMKNVYPCSINISIPKTKLRETAWSKLELGDEKKRGNISLVSNADRILFE